MRGNHRSKPTALVIGSMVAIIIGRLTGRLWRSKEQGDQRGAGREASSSRKTGLGGGAGSKKRWWWRRWWSRKLRSRWWWRKRWSS